FSSRRRHTIFSRDWSSDVCSSDLSFLGDASGPLAEVVRYRVGDEAVTVRTAGGERTVPGDVLTYLSAQLRRRRVELPVLPFDFRSEERRVGKVCKARGQPYQYKKL